MNKDLRAKLKKVDTVLTSFGYRLEVRFDNIGIIRTDINTDNPKNWIALVMLKTYSQDDKICALHFNAEPCVTTCGNSHITIEFSKAVCNSWKNMLNACEVLNSLHIVGPTLEISECVRDILSRKRK